MCRFLLYVGEPLTLDKLITEPEHSLIKQSYDSRLRSEPLNGDGFGMAWYAHDISPEPACFRSIQPAWNSANLRDLARVSRSSVVLAHVRAASPGLAVTEANCHPFTRGRLAFMHNGSIGGFLEAKRRIQRMLSDGAFASLHGSTDSEHAFALFCDRLDAEKAEGAERLAAALERTITDILEVTGDAEDASYLNFAVSDGENAAVTRFASEGSPPSLFMSRGRNYVCEEGVCRMVAPPGRKSAAVIVASEPLSEDDAWEEVPASTIVLVRPDRSVEVRALAVAAR